MKAAEIRDRSTEELLGLLEEKRQALFELEVRKGVADEASNPLLARTLRRTMARIQTVMKERESEQRHG